MLKDDTDELSVQEKMHIYTLDYARLFFCFAVIFGVILILLLALFINMNDNKLLFDPVSEAFSIILTLFIIIVPLLVWFIITGKKTMLDARQTMDKYTSDVYFAVLGLTPHKNDKNIPKVFYKMCLSIFPQLKRDTKNSIKNTGEGLEFKKITMKDEGTSFGVTIPGYIFYSNFELIITYFEKTNVGYDELNEHIKLLMKNYDNIYRVVCLARNFNIEILNEYKKLKKSLGADLDLIIVTDSGFSGLKISESH